MWEQVVKWYPDIRTGQISQPRATCDPRLASGLSVAANHLLLRMPPFWPVSFCLHCEKWVHFVVPFHILVNVWHHIAVKATQVDFRWRTTPYSTCSPISLEISCRDEKWRKKKHKFKLRGDSLCCFGASWQPLFVFCFKRDRENKLDSAIAITNHWSVLQKMAIGWLQNYKSSNKWQLTRFRQPKKRPRCN